MFPPDTPESIALAMDGPAVGDMPWEVFVDLMGRVFPANHAELEEFRRWWAEDCTRAALEMLMLRHGWSFEPTKRPARPPKPPQDGPVAKGRRPYLLTLNCGMGRDSIAMLCLLREGKLIAEGERLTPADVDAVIFSDTGAEWPHTYVLVPMVRLFCEEMGVPFLHLRKPPAEGALGWATNPRQKGDREPPVWTEGMDRFSLETQAFVGAFHRRPPIREAYLRDAKIAVTSSASCTDNHKVQPIRRARSVLCEDVFGVNLRTWSARARVGRRAPGRNPAWRRHRVMLGIAADEARRATYPEAPNFTPLHEWPVYPLMEMGVTKADEAAILRRWGFDELLPVFKSGCFMCPYQPVGWFHVLRERYSVLYDRVSDYEAAALAQNARMWVVNQRPLDEAVAQWVDRHPEQATDHEGLLRKAYTRGLSAGGRTKPVPQMDLFCGEDGTGEVDDGWAMQMPPEETMREAA